MCALCVASRKRLCDVFCESRGMLDSRLETAQPRLVWHYLSKHSLAVRLPDPKPGLKADPTLLNATGAECHMCRRGGVFAKKAPDPAAAPQQLLKHDLATQSKWMVIFVVVERLMLPH